MAGLYVHIPFCARRCRYCDFYFVTTQRNYGAFTNALIEEITYYARLYADKDPIETIYFGGGTPSRMPLEELVRIFETIRQRFDLSPLREVTFEVNPDDADRDYLTTLKEFGVDRLSIGVQSFFQSDLEWMNRAHTAEQSEAILEAVKAVGFKTFSVDLIFGLPEQPPEYWAANLEKALRLGAPHLSTYGLTVEEKTPLGKQVERGLVTPMPDEDARDQYLFTMQYLRERGFEHYEISSFALPGHRAEHNQLYWNHTNYFGFGPSANAFRWLTGSMARRWENVRHLGQYMLDLTEHHQLPLGFDEKIGPDALANEHIMLRLRTAEGLDLDHLLEKYGVDLLFEKPDELADLEAEGLIEPVRGTICLTDEGKTLADAIITKLAL